MDEVRVEKVLCECGGEIVSKDHKALCKECGLQLYPERIKDILNQAYLDYMKDKK